MISFRPNPECQYRQDYCQIVDKINDDLANGNLTEAVESVRKAALDDLFFFAYFILSLDIVNHPWLLQRVYEVQDMNDRTMDLWAREHGKSSIITYALNLWHATRDPEQRIGIFSHTRSIAKSFLRRIKHTCETNPNLRNFFPDVFWNDPKSEAPKWSEDDGLILRRKGQYQEATFEAWGIVDSMPTGKHFTVLNYDDVVTVESVSTPDQLAKTVYCFQLSLNLGEKTGIRRLIGTNYHFNDLYQQQSETGLWHVRRYPAIDQQTGTPVLLSEKLLDEKRRLMGSYVFSAQMLLNPVADENQIFKAEWLQFYDTLPQPMRLFGFVDPANAKKTKNSGSDYTVIAIIGLDADQNYFLVDMIRDRLSLTQHWIAIRDMYLKWQALGHRIVRFYYEQYGMLNNVEHFQHMMSEEGIYFDIKPIAGRLAKEDRIRKLQPLFESGRFWLPRTLMYGSRDLVQEFINQEYLTFPYSVHDDMLDSMSRCVDQQVKLYRPYAAEESGGNVISLHRYNNRLSGWARRKQESAYANA